MLRVTKIENKNLYKRRNMRLDKIASGAKYRIDENFRTERIKPSNFYECEHWDSLQFWIYLSERRKILDLRFASAQHWQ